MQLYADIAPVSLVKNVLSSESSVSTFSQLHVEKRPFAIEDNGIHWHTKNWLNLEV